MTTDKIMMQISAGQGPEECELAVAKLYDALCKKGGCFDVAFLWWFYWRSGPSDGSRFGEFRREIEMSALLAALAAVPVVEAVKMISGGAMMAVAVFSAAKTGRRRR